MSKTRIAQTLLITALVAGCSPEPAAEAQTWRTMTSSRQVWDREVHDVKIQYGAGTLSLEPAETPTLYHMEMRYDEGTTRPRAEYDQERRTLRLGLESVRGERRSGNRGGATASIALSREVPFDLDLDFGAGTADLELGGIALHRLDISTGASETRISFSEPNPIDAERIDIEAGAADLRVVGLGNARTRNINFQGGVGATVLDFSGSWSGEATASVQMGLGSLTLRLPREPGIRIRRSAFLTSFSVPGMERDGDSYYSPNWANATDRLTISVSAALGSVDIEWID